LLGLARRNERGQDTKKTVLDEEGENGGSVHDLGRDQPPVRPIGLITVISCPRFSSNTNLRSVSSLDGMARQYAGSAFYHIVQGILDDLGDFWPQNLLSLRGPFSQHKFIGGILREVQIFHAIGGQAHAVVDDDPHQLSQCGRPVS
jgi:hypothetical protein